MFTTWLTRGFLLILLCISLSFVVFLMTKPHDPGPFTQVASIGLSAWFGLNAIDRFTWDKPRNKKEEDSAPIEQPDCL